MFLTAATAGATPAPATPAGPDFAAIDAYVAAEMRDQRIPGLALGITHGDQIVHLKGFGVADESGRAVTPQTPFLIFSSTKSFTFRFAGLFRPKVDYQHHFGSRIIHERWCIPHFADIGLRECQAFPQNAAKVEIDRPSCRPLEHHAGANLTNRFENERTVSYIGELCQNLWYNCGQPTGIHEPPASTSPTIAIHTCHPRSLVNPDQRRHMTWSMTPWQRPQHWKRSARSAEPATP
jgi:hypothetical protein